MAGATRAGLIDRLAGEIADDRVLGALAHVPRDCFLPRTLRSRAWEDVALPIGGGQTISQPRVVARMCEALELRGHETVLDVGTGSGYHAAVLARLAARVVSIERDPDLVERASSSLATAGAGTIELLLGDGADGGPPDEAYEAINVAAASDEAALAAFASRLADGGRLVLPLDSGGEHQELVLVRREGATLRREHLGPVSFVPLTRGVVRDPGDGA